MSILPSTKTKGAKTVRKDVARNRELLLESAREVFAERGLDATLDDIAKHAGVGVGTAYRHFANKQEIAAEVLAESSELLVQDARSALEIADPWLALTTFFDRAFTRSAHNRGLHETAMAAGGEDGPHLRSALIEAIITLFDRAKASGAIRPDAEPTDLAPVFAMMAVAFDMSAVSTPDLWRRYLALWLDGFRAGARDPLPVPPLALADLNAALSAAKRH